MFQTSKPLFENGLYVNLPKGNVYIYLDKRI